jgi:hypothetical protein
MSQLSKASHRLVKDNKKVAATAALGHEPVVRPKAALGLGTTTGAAKAVSSAAPQASSRQDGRNFRVG